MGKEKKEGEKKGEDGNRNRERWKSKEGKEKARRK